MTMPDRKVLSLAATFVATVLWASFGLAQDPAKPKDDALDSLLEKLEGARSNDKAADKAKPEDAAKPKSPESSGARPGPAGAKGSGDVETKDKALDSLLEKLGETRDAPSPDERPKGGPGGPPHDKPSPKPAKPDAHEPQGKAKDLDRHLEDLTGRRRKKKDDEEGGGGPLSEVIKEMRDVEQRLGKPDTGEETRKKQAEIVKNLETLIEQLKKSQSQSQGKRKNQLVAKQGQQPGQNPGQDPGAQAGQAPRTKPERPTSNRSLAGGKDEWGHLPPELRQEMDNVLNEEGLPSQVELIRRYYLSLSKKIVVRGE